MKRSPEVLNFQSVIKDTTPWSIRENDYSHVINNNVYEHSYTSDYRGENRDLN